jgi:hypothetical protein
VADLFVEACLGAGLPFVKDFNALPRAKEHSNARENHDRTGSAAMVLRSFLTIVFE